MSAIDPIDFLLLSASGDAAERADAVRRAANSPRVLQQADSRRRLMACLADDDWLVRELAVGALQAANAVEAVPQLERLAFVEDDETVRAAIAEALGSLGSSTSVEAITALFQRGDEAVRGYAAGALGQLERSSANEELLRNWLAAEQSPHVRAKGLANLAWRGPDDAKRFRRFVEVADGEVAEVAASELGFVLASASPLPDVVEEIEVALRALAKRVPSVRASADRALQRARHE